ncbi:MAG: hypothetical protein RDV48_24355 [Candidatus Eremiobacteraeota bacterium]|nr:hypothetical protein [Candidatus Eremiobacteraeota bacterium]
MQSVLRFLADKDMLKARTSGFHMRADRNIMVMMKRAPGEKNNLLVPAVPFLSPALYSVRDNLFLYGALGALIEAHDALAMNSKGSPGFHWKVSSSG